MTDKEPTPDAGAPALGSPAVSAVPWGPTFAALVSEAKRRRWTRARVARELGVLPKDVTRWTTVGATWSRVPSDLVVRRLAALLGLALLVGAREVSIVDAGLAARIVERAGR